MPNYVIDMPKHVIMDEGFRAATSMVAVTV